jgi:predicted outer membrane lipoprotein
LGQVDAVKSFGRVLGVTLSDAICMTFPLPKGESLVLLGSGGYSQEATTGIVKLNQAGNIISSHIINAGFEQVIQLSNQKFLLVSKDRDWRVNKDGLIFTWLDPDGKLIQTKQFSFDYSHFYLPVIASVRELKEGSFEVIISGYSRDESANLRDDSTLRLLFNAEGSLTQSTRIPLSYYGLSAGELGITYPKWFESKDFGLSLCENSGKTQWSKKVKLPKVEKKKEITDFKNQWLPDNSLLVSMINKNEDLYLTRLDGSGKSIWNVRITEKSKYKLVSLGSATLLSNGNLAVSLYLQEKDDVYYQPILLIDREGKIVRTMEINPEANSIGIDITEGSEGDLWILGSTVAYAFGSSNALLFRLSGDMKTCYESKITFVSSGDVLVVEDAPKEKDLAMKPYSFKNSSIPLETTMDSVLALTKELCP